MTAMGPMTRALRRYLAMTPEQRTDLRETFATWAAEYYEKAQVYARRFLDNPKALTASERLAGASAFEKWRKCLRDRECIEEAMRPESNVIQFRPQRPALFVVPDDEPPQPTG